MDLLLATSNTGKVCEMREALDLPGLTLLDLRDVPPVGQPEETGKTFAENAVQKARYYHEHARLPCVADDSGIHVAALEGELGIHTRRWGAGPKASDAEWIAYFLDRMKHETDKRAEFVCALAYIDAEDALHMFEARCTGIITGKLEADYLPGLPVSACFKPDGEDAVFSALTIERKNATSHRGKALLQLREYLQEHA
jgi:XTP/dITP diphosphohydrolase